MKDGGQNHGTTQFEARERALQSIRSEARICAQEGSSLAVLAVEFDRFDALCASAGGEAAEDIFMKLQRAAQVHCGRDRDHVFRTASDRILAVCPKTLPVGAWHVASQIREAADLLPAHADGSPVTLSIGIAASAPTGDEAANALLDRAEQSLETAHRSGGNRIVGAASASPSPAPASLRKLMASMLPAKRIGSVRRQGD